MGIKCSNTAEVYFDNTPIPAENMICNVGDGFKVKLYRGGAIRHKVRGRSCSLNYAFTVILLQTDIVPFRGFSKCVGGNCPRNIEKWVFRIARAGFYENLIKKRTTRWRWRC